MHKRFSPEIARRLGNPAFTKHLSVSAMGLDDFVERPVPLLQEVIRTLDPASRAAIALVFMRGGWLPSPVYGWRAKHPTVLDAFASLVAENRELMDIYLAGTPVRQLLSEVACGDSSFGGLAVTAAASSSTRSMSMSSCADTRR